MPTSDTAFSSPLLPSTARPSPGSASLLPRVHWFEIAESAWCPAVIRDGVTDYLQHVIDRTQPYAGVVPFIQGATARGDSARHVVDLGSGAGGPWRTLSASLDDVRVTLTDKWPNLDAFAQLASETDGRVRGESVPVRADEIPGTLPGTRTMFSAFHHLTRAEARWLLRRTTQSGHSIAIFEATRRHPVALLATLLVPLLVWLMTPAIRPFRWSRLVWTYVIPVIPLVALFDGLVSCLRTWTPDELLDLATQVAPSGVQWSSGLIEGTPIPVTYLVGRRL